MLFVSFQAVLIHANVSWRFGPVRWLLATPQYHHWHHAVEPVDVNFAVHLPVIDAVFGTLYLLATAGPPPTASPGLGCRTGTGPSSFFRSGRSGESARDAAA